MVIQYWQLYHIWFHCLLSGKLLYLLYWGGSRQMLATDICMQMMLLSKVLYIAVLYIPVYSCNWPSRLIYNSLLLLEVVYSYCWLSMVVTDAVDGPQMFITVDFCQRSLYWLFRDVYNHWLFSRVAKSYYSLSTVVLFRKCTTLYSDDTSSSKMTAIKLMWTWSIFSSDKSVVLWSFNAT